MVKVSLAQELETNRVIRKYSSFLPNFLRLSFVNEELDKNYYFSVNNSSNNFLLGFIHNIIQNGLELGGLLFKFIGYSNS